MFIASPERPASQVEQQECQPHGQLWEEIVKGGSDRKLQAVIEERTLHEVSLRMDQDVGGR
jgi:hypothetical protein